MTDKEMQEAMEQYEHYQQHSVAEDGTISYDFLINLIRDYSIFISGKDGIYKGEEGGLIQFELYALREKLTDGNPPRKEDFVKAKIIANAIYSLNKHFHTKGAFKESKNPDGRYYPQFEKSNPNFFSVYNRIGSDIIKSVDIVKGLVSQLEDDFGEMSCSQEITSILEEEKQVKEIQPFHKLQWVGKPAHLAFTIDLLIEKGFLVGTPYGERTAEILLNIFEIKGYQPTKGSLGKLLNKDNYPIKWDKSLIDRIRNAIPKRSEVK